MVEMKYSVNPLERTPFAPEMWPYKRGNLALTRVKNQYFHI